MSEWEQLVRQGGHERSKDHLDKVLEELGPMPDPGSEPGKLSMWVGVSRNAAIRRVLCAGDSSRCALNCSRRESLLSRYE